MHEIGRSFDRAASFIGTEECLGRQAREDRRRRRDIRRDCAVNDMEGHLAKIRDEIARLDLKIDRLDQRISELLLELWSYVDQRFTQVDGTLWLHNWGCSAEKIQIGDLLAERSPTHDENRVPPPRQSA
jgi:hypothetical protein